ncbi:MAG: peptidase [Zetaproteobacteria bacterium]|nr:peptidase [Zetaproteobacteria bacterium]
MVEKISRLLPKRELAMASLIEGVDALVLEPMVEIPLLGSIAAGKPLDCFVSDERTQVPAAMVSKRNGTYALRVKGNSMIEERHTAENDQSVVALIDDHRVTLKRFFIEKNCIRLQPANHEMIESQTCCKFAYRQFGHRHLMLRTFASEA